MEVGRRTREQVRRWWWPVAAVLIVLIVVWATGGFRSVAVAAGRTESPGSVIELARWRIVVDSAELVDTSSEADTGQPPEIRVGVRATFTGDRSTYGLPSTMITLAPPEVGPPVDATPRTRGDRTGDFDPDVEQPVVLGFAWSNAPARGPATIRVLIRNERPAENFLFVDEWELAPRVVVHVDLPCPDRRGAR